MNKRILLAILSAVALAMGFSACSNDDDDVTGNYQLTASVQLVMMGNDMEESLSIYKCYVNTLGVSMSEDGGVTIEGKDSVDCINKILILSNQAHEKLCNDTWNDVTRISVFANTEEVYSQKYGVKADNDDNQPEAVDLGLPSGTLWASSNVDASGYGFMCDFYRFHVRDKDHATEVLGDNWCTPTKKQMEELITSDQVEWKWKTVTMDNIMPGYNIISKKTGKSIFLPAYNGVYFGTDSVSTDLIGTGCYLTSTNAYPDVWNTLDHQTFDPDFLIKQEKQTGYILCFTEDKISIGITPTPHNISSNYLYPLRAVRK